MSTTNPINSNTSAVAAQESEDGIRIGRNLDSKLGFYGAAPIVQNATAFSLGAGTVAQLATLLGNLGLIKTGA
jgi:hypothetical protein